MYNLRANLRFFLLKFVTQENHQRVNIFFDYAKKTKNTAWSYFLPMLNRQDLFTVHMVSYPDRGKMHQSKFKLRLQT